MLGDFNNLLSPLKKFGGAQYRKNLIAGFRSTVEDCGLFEIPSSGPFFTWERSRGTVNWVREKLDRGFANDSWFRLFHSPIVRVLNT